MKLALILIGIVAVPAITGILVFVYVIQNVEQPHYDVVVQDGDVELRDYPSLVVAEVTRAGSRQQGLSTGFGPLARAILRQSARP